MHSSSNGLRSDHLSIGLRRLAELVEEGIPLEAALRHIVDQGVPSDVRVVFLGLASDLERGIPAEQALERQGLEPLFSCLFLAGSRSQQLEMALNLLADHYQRMGEIQLRLKTMLFYPGMVLVASALCSLLLSSAFLKAHEHLTMLRGMTLPNPSLPGTGAEIFWVCMAWFPLVLLVLTAVWTIRAAKQQPFQTRLLWKLPGFKEWSLSRTSSLFHLLLSGATPIAEAVRHVERYEIHPQLKSELNHWLNHLQQGHPSFPDPDNSNSLLPALMKWLAMGSSHGWADGFRRASEYYHNVATRSMDHLLRLLFPSAILLVGMCVFFQVLCLLLLFTNSLPLLTWN